MISCEKAGKSPVGMGSPKVWGVPGFWGSLLFGLNLPQLRDSAAVPDIYSLPTRSKPSRADPQPHNEPQPGYTHCCCSQSPREGMRNAGGAPPQPHQGRCY